VLELQLIKAAVISKGFCTAFVGLVNALEGKQSLTAAQKTAYWQPFRDAANDPSGRYWCDKDVNAEVRRAHSSTAFLKFNCLLQKRAVVANVAGTGKAYNAWLHMAVDAKIFDYMKEVQDDAKKAAEDIDAKADKVIEDLYKHAENTLKDQDPWADENLNFSCDIVAAKKV
jgi:hypothetical protein